MILTLKTTVKATLFVVEAHGYKKCRPQYDHSRGTMQSRRSYSCSIHDYDVPAHGCVYTCTVHTDCDCTVQ